MITTVVPGTNTLSAAVSAMSNGDVICLLDGVYYQNVAVAIPNGVNRFAIIGQGSGVTKLVYTANVDGIKSNLSDLAYRIHQGKLAGFQMIYESAVPGTKKAISLLGSSYNDTGITNIDIDDIALMYGTWGTCWNKGLVLINARAGFINKFWSRFSPSSRIGTAIELQSCANIKIDQAWIMSCSIGLDQIKAADNLISDPIKHGCEDICLSQSSVHICDIGVNLGYKCFMSKLSRNEFEYCAVAGIQEDTSQGFENGGYHFIDNNYIGMVPSAANLVWLKRDGTTFTNNNVFGVNTTPFNGLRLDGSKCIITGNIYRFMNGTGILVTGGVNIIGNNMFEGSSTQSTDIYIYNAGAVGNLVSGNMIDTTILNNGIATVLRDNPVH